MELQAKILTVSSSVAHGDATDRSGEALRELLEKSGFTVVDQDVVVDGVEMVGSALRDMSDGYAGLLVTTGGTGFSPSDLTPEATIKVVDRLAPGLSEAMRHVNPKGRLSRGVAGIVGSSLIVNTPGSPDGAVECLGAVIDVLPHALELLGGENPHPQTAAPHGHGDSHDHHHEDDHNHEHHH